MNQLQLQPALSPNHTHFRTFLHENTTNYIHFALLKARHFAITSEAFDAKLIMEMKRRWTYPTLSIKALA